MKTKFFISLLLLLSIGVLTTSCEKSDPKNYSILGSWKITSSQSVEEIYGQFGVGAVWTFGDNGDLTIVVDGKSATLAYSRNGKELTIEELLPLTISSLTPSSMVLRYTEEGVEFLKVTFQKITHVK